MSRDQLVSLIDLQGLFGVSSKEGGGKFALVLGPGSGSGSRKTGFLADRLLGQHELVIKAIDNHYSQSGFVSGASILGNGKVVLILDAPAMVKKAIEHEKERCVA